MGFDPEIGYVYIIELDEKYKKRVIQCGGTACCQQSFKGKVIDKFKTNSMWFSQDFWHEKTCWCNDKDKIYFELFGLIKNFPEFDEKNEKKYNKALVAIYEEATEKAIPIDNILNNILSIVYTKTNKKFELDFINKEYDIFWTEAFIPLKLDNKKYLLTWANCD